MRVPPLIDAIYEAALRPAGWQPVLQGMADLLNARDCSVATYNFKTGAYANDSLPIDPEYLRRYNERWVHENFLWDATHTLPVGTLFSFETAMSRAEFEKTAFFNEWWRPQGMVHALGANILATNAVSSVATFHRPSSRRDFDRRDATRLRSLLPHLSRAMEIRQRLDSDAGVAEDFRACLEELRKPAFLVNSDCRLLFANSAAETLMQAGDLTGSARSALVARCHHQTRTLHRLVGDIFCNGSAGGRLALERLDARPLTLTIAPLHHSANPFVHPSALILVDDPSLGAPFEAPVTFLRTLYQLTNAEAELALLIAKGRRLRQAAEERGICIATARTHLAHVFQKTGTASQSELIRLLIASGISGSSGAFS